MARRTLSLMVSMHISRHKQLTAVTAALVLGLFTACAESESGSPVPTSPPSSETTTIDDRPTSTVVTSPAGDGELIEGTPPVVGVDPPSCVDPDPPSPDLTVVLVFFHCDAAGTQPGLHTVGIGRETGGSQPLHAALAELTRGPTPEEQQVGLYSPFSESSTSLIGDIGLTVSVATVDFSDDLYRMFAVGTTAGSSVFLAELRSTIFQFETVTQVVFTVDGSSEDWCSFVVGDPECGPFTANAD